MRRGEEDGNGGDDGEGREGDEAEPVDHHRRELHAHSARPGREGAGRCSLAAAPYCTVSKHDSQDILIVSAKKRY